MVRPLFGIAASAALTSLAIAASIAPTKLLAQQLVYPSTSDPNGVMVTGQGSASAPADVADIRLLVSRANPSAADEALRNRIENSGKPGSPPPAGKPNPPGSLTEADLKPIVAAIAAVGVPASAIQVSVDDGKSNRFYRQFSLAAPSGTVRVTLEKPNQSRVRSVVDAAETAAKAAKLFPQASVRYRVTDCTALEQAAYTAAVKDAQRRAQAIATAMGAQLAARPSIAEAFYATFFPSTCNPSMKSFYPNSVDPAYETGFEPYSASTETIVETRKDIFATYKTK